MPMQNEWSKWGPAKYITGTLIENFADLTDNHQWIHEDHYRSEGEPYNGQIAHGLLLVALIPRMLPDDGDLPPHSVRVIRGIDRLRLPSPVYPRNFVHTRVRRIATYAAQSGKGTIIERDVEVWAKARTCTKPAVACVLKMQYF